MLQVISKIKKQNDIIVKSTFLGAHAFPREFTNNKKGILSFLSIGQA